MKTPTRLLLGTLATAAALSDAAAGAPVAHAAAGSSGPSGSAGSAGSSGSPGVPGSSQPADLTSSPVESLLCPMMAPGSLVWSAVNDLNSESAARSCRGTG